MKIPGQRVFISHPVSGNVAENLAMIAKICREIHSQDVLPIFPSFTTRQYLTPDPKDRELAAIQIYTYLSSGIANEIWFYGDILTEGMEREFEIASLFNLRIVSMTHEMRKVLNLKRGQPDFYPDMPPKAIVEAREKISAALRLVERRREEADILCRQLNADLSRLQGICPHLETRSGFVMDVAEMRDRDFCVSCGAEL